MAGKRLAQFPIHYAELQAVYAQTIVKGVRSLAIASAESGEGVSTLAYALARRTAAAGRQTLYVDFNLFRPIINEMLGVPREPWSPDDSSAVDSIVRFREESFAVLAAPTGATAAVSFREMPVLEGIFKRWLEEFDCVIADTSPLNNINSRNIPAELICAACEATVLVVLAGRTPETSIRRAVGRLQESHANLTAAVINDRFNPHLADELVRETQRFDRFMPRLMEQIRQRIRASTLLTARI
jgi:protein-tyrosine kinase